jgi:hypothetical protein
VTAPADCEPDWTPTTSHEWLRVALRQHDHTPPTWLVRLQELGDLQDQGARLGALQQAETVPTGEYL